MKTPKQPWYRSSNDSWYVCLNGKQIRLAKGKARRREAQRALHRLMARLDECGNQLIAAPRSTVPVAIVLDDFLEWVEQNLQSYSR